MAQGKSPSRKRATPKKSAAPTAAAAAPEAQAPESPQATFVFQGTVLALGSTTLAEVPAAHDTIVARVDDIHRGPAVLQDFIGQAVTVRLGEGQTVEPDQEYLFHTMGWVFGAGLAVVCLSLEPAHPGAVAALQAQLMAAPDDAVRQRAARADLVIQGHVSQIREVKREPGHPITEHDPQWQDAVVQVHETPGATMGRAAPKEVVVRFAASKDVRWAKAPKFRVGYKGLWLLGDTSEPVAAARSAMALTKDHYLCVEPEDFYPEERVHAVKATLNATGGRS